MGVDSKKVGKSSWGSLCWFSFLSFWGWVTVILQLSSFYSNPYPRADCILRELLWAVWAPEESKIKHKTCGTLACLEESTPREPKGNFHKRLEEPRRHCTTLKQMRRGCGLSDTTCKSSIETLEGKKNGNTNQANNESNDKPTNTKQTQPKQQQKTATHTHTHSDTHTHTHAHTCAHSKTGAAAKTPK